jgi:hypothetical protein
MMWLTWRRYRVRIILLALYVLGLILLMVLTEHAFANAAVICGRQHIPIDQGFRCGAASGAESRASWVESGITLLPVIIGLVFGAPLLASEIEGKTNRLAWSQGVTRTRWLLSSWSTLAIPTVIIMSLLALVVQWWATHIVTSISSGGGLMEPAQFDISGVGPIAFALFALSLGTCIGVMFRRYVSPYVVTTVGLLVVLGIMPTVVVPLLAPRVAVPVTANGTTESYTSVVSHAWSVGSGVRRTPGFQVTRHTSSLSGIVGQCGTSSRYAGGSAADFSKYLTCLNNHGAQAVNFYQPLNHYWILQWREAGIYTVLAAGLLGLSVWMVRRWRA